MLQECHNVQEVSLCTTSRASVGMCNRRSYIGNPAPTFRQSQPGGMNGDVDRRHRVAEYRYRCVLLEIANPRVSTPRDTCRPTKTRYLTLGAFDAEALENTKYHAHDTRRFIYQGQHFAPAMINLASC